MALKVEIIGLIADEDSEGNKRLRVHLREIKPRQFFVNLSKASADEIKQFMEFRGGGVAYVNFGEMVQNGSFSLFYKPGGEIDVISKPEPIAGSAVDGETGEIVEGDVTETLQGDSNLVDENLTIAGSSDDKKLGRTGKPIYNANK